MGHIIHSKKSHSRPSWAIQLPAFLAFDGKILAGHVPFSGKIPWCSWEIFPSSLCVIVFDQAHPPTWSFFREVYSLKLGAWTDGQGLAPQVPRRSAVEPRGEVKWCGTILRVIRIVRGEWRAGAWRNLSTACDVVLPRGVVFCILC